MFVAATELLMQKLARLHKSLTFWFNVLMSFLAFGIPELLNALPTVAAYIPAPTYGKVLLATVLGNLVLRFKTNRALQDK